jgi:hypothetical protein
LPAEATAPGRVAVSSLRPPPRHNERRLELAAGIAITLSDLITALVGWAVAKLRGYDLFDQVMREAERTQEVARSPDKG